MRSVPFAPLALCALLAAGFAGGAHAQAGPAQTLLDGKFVGNLGGFIVGTDLKATLNGSTVNNPDIDFDKTFGNADNTRIRADGLWRITPTHHLRFLYFDDSTSRKRVIDEDLAWGDDVFTAGGEVKSKTQFRIYEFAYEYAFIHQPTYEVSGSLGVHYMDLSAQLSGNATVTDANGNVSTGSFTSKRGNGTVPAPVIGIRAGWAVSPEIYLEAQGQFFKADIGGYDTLLTDARANATYMFSKNFGAGIGYNVFRTTVDVDKDSFNGRLRVGYRGLLLFLTGTF